MIASCPSLATLVSGLSFYETLAAPEITRVIAFERNCRANMQRLNEFLISSSEDEWSLGGWEVSDNQLILKIEIGNHWSSPDILHIEMTPDWQEGKPLWAEQRIARYLKQIEEQQSC